MLKKNIAIFASGEGTNAQRIIDHFQDSGIARVALLLCNKPGANVIARAEKAGVPTIVFNRSDFYESDKIIRLLKDQHIDLIVLAGFLWMIPGELIQAFPRRIVNIHPALLPKFGGKGMYGMNVHKAVMEAGEKNSGITIHFVDENYDEGEIIAQFKCGIAEGESCESLAGKIHQLEHDHFPAVIENIIKKL
jgi:phosphoribosylglycinamide formyltransferase-1